MSEFKSLSRPVKGLTVLVKGASSGMGSVFAAEGANVAVTDISADGAQKVADEIAATGGSARAWRLDVGNRDDIQAVNRHCARLLGRNKVTVQTGRPRGSPLRDRHGVGATLVVALLRHPASSLPRPPASAKTSIQNSQ